MKPWTFSAATLTVAALGLPLSPAGAVGQPKPSCAAGKTGKPAAITAREAWDLATVRAHAWQADAVPFQFTTTSGAPLDAEGRSTDWEISFSSGKAKAVDMISVSDGQIRCYALPGAGGRALKAVDHITFDSKKLYERAQKAGGDKVGPGSKIMAGLEQETSGRPAWYLNYQDAQGREVLSVVIDAQTGKVQNVFHSKK
jgi:hypothetical protein